MTQKLRHENLVNMIEVFRRKKRFFLVFEYLEHTVLEELEARSGGLGYITSRKYIYQVLRALDFIHSHDVSSFQYFVDFLHFSFEIFMFRRSSIVI